MMKSQQNFIIFINEAAADKAVAVDKGGITYIVQEAAHVQEHRPVQEVISVQEAA